MGAIKDQIQKQIPGVYVYSIEFGSDIVEDELQGFFGNVNDQVRVDCPQQPPPQQPPQPQPQQQQTQ